jgi:hypothetical protein
MVCPITLLRSSGASRSATSSSDLISPSLCAMPTASAVIDLAVELEVKRSAAVPSY